MLQTTKQKFNHGPSWQKEFQNALKDSSAIENFFDLNKKLPEKYKSFIPISFAKKIKNSPINGPLRRQFIPNAEENSLSGLIDPIGDKARSQGHGVIHRYSNRLLFTPTTVCPITCRYCFRKNELNTNSSLFKSELNFLKQYLEAHPEVNEVILTGGDPLILSDEKLERIFNLLTHMNIQFLRIHTRTPIILPSRINQDFRNLLNRFSNRFTKIIFVLHTNHSMEIDDEVQKSLNSLRECRIDKKSQTVLLKNINDSSESLLELFYKLLNLDFTPYYLHHPDKVRGAMHFYLPLERGRKIYAKLRNSLPGWALPHYVIDHSEGQGKQLAFNPESFKYSGKLIDKDGLLVDY